MAAPARRPTTLGSGRVTPKSRCRPPTGMIARSSRKIIGLARAVDQHDLARSGGDDCYGAGAADGSSTDNADFILVKLDWG
jgi:hypothetical protein